MSKSSERALPAVTGGPRRAGASVTQRAEPGVGQHFEDRNLMQMKLPKDQFAPSEAEPVRQRYKMAGGC